MGHRLGRPGGREGRKQASVIGRLKSPVQLANQNCPGLPIANSSGDYVFLDFFLYATQRGKMVQRWASAEGVAFRVPIPPSISFSINVTRRRTPLALSYSFQLLCFAASDRLLNIVPIKISIIRLGLGRAT